MKKLFLALMIVASIIFVQPVYSITTGNINFSVGQKFMESSDWKPVTELTEARLSFDITSDDWPVSIAINYGSAVGSKNTDMFGFDTTLTLDTQEFDIGIKKIWDFGDQYDIYANEPQSTPFHIYLGGGISNITATATIDVPGFGKNEQTDANIGLWLSAGLYYTLYDHLNLGAEVRYTSANVDFGTNDGLEIGGTHYGAFVGYCF